MTNSNVIGTGALIRAIKVVIQTVKLISVSHVLYRITSLHGCSRGQSDRTYLSFSGRVLNVIGQ